MKAMVLSLAVAMMTMMSAADTVERMRIGGLTRTSVVHVPTSLPRGRKVPLVLMLHGGGGTGRGAADETGWSVKADGEGFVVAYPEGTQRDPGSPGRFLRNPRTWNDGSGRLHAGERDVDDVGFLRALLERLSARLPVDPRRIYITGFSNGASMTFRAGAELSDRVAAIAPVAGACWLSPVRLERPVSLCYISGDSDPLNPMAGGMPRLARSGIPLGGREKPPVAESIRRWREALACDGEPLMDEKKDGVRTVRYAGCNGEPELVFVTIQGQGHVWPGGKSLLPATMVGASTGRLHATDFVWEFFQHHLLPSSATID